MPHGLPVLVVVGLLLFHSFFPVFLFQLKFHPHPSAIPQFTIYNNININININSFFHFILLNNTTITRSNNNEGWLVLFNSFHSSASSMLSFFSAFNTYSLSVCFFESQKAQVGLWSVWLYGFLLIGLSLYATQRLPPSFKHDIKRPNFHPKGFADSANPSITIFSAPGPLTGSIQTLAIRSWLALTPQITVILFSQHPSVVSFARAFGSRVFVDPNIDFT